MIRKAAKHESIKKNVLIRGTENTILFICLHHLYNSNLGQEETVMDSGDIATLIWTVQQMHLARVSVKDLFPDVALTYCL